uniref:Uncharacterized protein n=1 Tax=Odontella aurita TaxID=265563 RepID=A0A7S4MXQ2_9STRA
MPSSSSGGGGGGGGGSSSIPTPEESRIIRREGGRILDRMTPEHSSFFARVRCRDFPCFERREMGLGRTLGMGTFCRVAEILEIRLKDEGKGDGGGEKEEEDDEDGDDDAARMPSHT